MSIVASSLSGGTARDALRAFVGADGSGDSSGGGEGSGGGGEASLAVRLAELAVGAAGHTLGTSLGAAQDGRHRVRPDYKAEASHEEVVHDEAGPEPVR